MDHLAEISTPTLVLAGEADRPEFQASGEYLVRKMPDARLITVPGGEHSMHEDAHAEVVAEAIDSFVRGLG
jgi:pimeloyl-ACP methyl ester carboxylesterase